jgi:hypothetical protein
MTTVLSHAGRVQFNCTLVLALQSMSSLLRLVFTAVPLMQLLLITFHVHTYLPGKSSTRAIDQKTLRALGAGHPFPLLVLEFRSLFHVANATIRRLELPLQYCAAIAQHRLLPTVDFRTSTGRIKFMAPCLQNIPKTITVAVSPVVYCTRHYFFVNMVAVMCMFHIICRIFSGSWTVWNACIYI